ncbi:trehalase isoform X2 [Tachyglossus aculeatus]|uniref:trehalase isoform X2 n=1 Tax=Tachyglossus aculeatus TaxID=9261 RepID=UPI0018F2F305|nr:trehalase isoform X2 [Tachyglossus aculeatus]
MRGSGCWLGLGLLAGLALGAALPPPCPSEIFCFGSLLRQVQMAKLFPDDKEFVDMPLNKGPSEVLQDFNQLEEREGPNLTQAQLRAFVGKHFQPAGQELETWVPGDWKDSLPLLQNISDPELRAWAGALHGLWKILGRKMKDEVRIQPERYSLLPAKNPFIVPGGRFAEFYYWDSYWVMQGLLLSEMPSTVKGMLQNFLDLVEDYGHIPNGGRVYYLQRSQPPLLALMMDRYVAHTQDTAFLRANIHLLEKELDFWRQNRTVTVTLGSRSYKMFRYYVPFGGPRPESYSKDAELAEPLGQADREELWSELKAGAESGWDFSSRWFDLRQEAGTLRDTRTSHTVPVDLNAFLCQAMGLLAKFHTILGNQTQARAFQDQRAECQAALSAVLWDPQAGTWFDYNLAKGQRHQAFFPSNLAPLWAGCAPGPEEGDRAVKYLQDSGILNFGKGIPTSLKQSGEQWDYPNAWAPLQELVITGLAESGSERAGAAAFVLAQNWIRTNVDTYKRHKHITT